MDKLKVGESATITFTLSEVSADFDTTDIVVTGGILTDFALKANETKIYNISPINIDITRRVAKFITCY
jgi:hypothetical protein